MVKRDDFEERLRQARAREGLDHAPEGRDVLPRGALGLGLRVGVELVSTLVIGAVIGFMLDRWLGTLPLFFLLLFALGGVAGVLNILRLFRRVAQEKSGPE